MPEAGIFRRVHFALIFSIIPLGLSACADSAPDGVNRGGLTPPPGFLERVDANCRLAAQDLALTPTPPSIRQLNGQSLLSYGDEQGETVVCVVRHRDESVIDIRVIGAE